MVSPFLLLFGLVLIAHSGVADYNVHWTTPSKDVSGSMPLGNGVMAANVWVEPQNSQFGLYIARPDAWDENADLLKLTKISITVDPPIDISSLSFDQTLDLPTSTIFITLQTPKFTLVGSFWIDYHSPQLICNFTSTQDFTLEVKMEPWRTTKQPVLPNFQGWFCDTRYTYPDVIVSSIKPFFPKDILEWYHRNEDQDYFASTLNRQGLGSAQSSVPNILLGRQFGGAIFGPDLQRVTSTKLVSKSLQKEIILIVATHTSQTSDVLQWEQQLNAIIKTNPSRMKHEVSWKMFWDQSFIFLTPAKTAKNQKKASEETFTVTQQYLIWRLLQAWQSKAPFPIKFNGMLYVAQDGLSPDDRYAVHLLNHY
jgi:alpha-L-fucosidase 2